MKVNVIDIRSVSFIDGPFFDFLLKFPLHLNITRRFVLWLENLFTKKHWFWGRHLVIKARK